METAADTRIIPEASIEPVEEMVTLPETANLMSLVDKIEIANSSGQSLILSSLDKPNGHSIKKHQEIIVRGNAAIGDVI